VAAAWTRLYGFPFDPRLWAAFALHDLGYLGKRNMDGDEGERHVELGASFMGLLFDRDYRLPKVHRGAWEAFVPPAIPHRWEDFTKYHSRFYAKRDGHAPSRLCVADKLALTLTPWWLYLPMVNLTGEIHEYMQLAGKGKYAGESLSTSSQRQWYFDMQQYILRWVEEHKDGRADTWTMSAMAVKEGV
jgi:hypothetical protein